MCLRVQRFTEGPFDDVARKGGPDVGILTASTRSGIQVVVTRIVPAVRREVICNVAMTSQVWNDEGVSPQLQQTRAHQGSRLANQQA
jgi:hypothetical protein